MSRTSIGAALLVLLLGALAGCAGLTQLAAGTAETLPWDCGDPPSNAAAHPALGEAGGNADGGSSSSSTP